MSEGVTRQHIFSNISTEGEKIPTGIRGFPMQIQVKHWGRKRVPATATPPAASASWPAPRQGVEGAHLVQD